MSDFKPGQRIRGSFPFVDSKVEPPYPRFYLIAAIEGDKAYIYNITSMKLDNMHQVKYSDRYAVGTLEEAVRPFTKGSFIKLEQLQMVPLSDLEEKTTISCRGATLDPYIFNDIKKRTVEGLYYGEWTSAPENIPLEFQAGIELMKQAEQDER